MPFQLARSVSFLTFFNATLNSHVHKCMKNLDKTTPTKITFSDDEDSGDAELRNARNSVLLRNRMKLCAFSICLMWASSLRTATYISSFVIDIPRARMLFKSCKASIQIILEEEDRFSSCTNLQMTQCEQELETTIRLEKQRVDTLSNQNTAVVVSVKTLVSNCSNDFTLLKRSLEELVALSKPLPINNDTCSSQDEEIMMSTVFDVNILRSEALAASMRYSRDSRNKMQNVVEYAKVRTAYDAEYSQKYMDMVSYEVKKYISLTPIPYHAMRDELVKLEKHIDNLLSCTTLSQYVCEFPSLEFGLSEMWDEYKFETSVKWVELEDYWSSGCAELILRSTDFAEKAFSAYAKFNDFRTSELH